MCILAQRAQHLPHSHTDTRTPDHARKREFGCCGCDLVVIMASYGVAEVLRPATMNESEDLRAKPWGLGAPPLWHSSRILACKRFRERCCGSPPAMASGGKMPHNSAFVQLCTPLCGEDLPHKVAQVRTYAPSASQVRLYALDKLPTKAYNSIHWCTTASFGGA